jgi:fluoride exporter
MQAAVIVFLGAGLGGAARYGLNVIVTRMMGTSFPFGILLVNLLGCFVMGILAGWFALRGEAGMSMRLFLMTGVLGGFTTFSAFALDTAILWERNTPGSAALYVMASVLGSLAALGAGLALARAVA